MYPVKTYRLYLNSLDSEYLWSIDDGHIETEKVFKRVSFDGHGVTKQDLSADNIKSPKVWLEFPYCVLYIKGENAQLKKFLDIE